MDSEWAHYIEISVNKSGTICKYCGQVNKSEAITRFKDDTMCNYCSQV